MLLSNTHPKNLQTSLFLPLSDRKRLQRVVKTAQKIIGCSLPSLRNIFSSRCFSRAETITGDSIHPAHHLFDLLPSGRRYRSINTRTNRLRNSFLPQAITALNTNRHWHTHTHTYQWQMSNNHKYNHCIVLYTKTHIYLFMYFLYTILH